MYCRPTTTASAVYIIILYLALHGGLFNWKLVGLSCMATHESHDRLRCYDLVDQEHADNWVPIFMVPIFIFVKCLSEQKWVPIFKGAYI